MFVFIVGRFCETPPRSASDTDALQHLSDNLSVYHWGAMVKQERRPVIRTAAAEQIETPAIMEMRTRAAQVQDRIALRC
jgi:hypothetical protein